jgi:hypothetical protein
MDQNGADAATTWSQFESSVGRGCDGCKALKELLLAAAEDDNVAIIQNGGVSREMKFVWGLAKINKPYPGVRTGNGLLSIDAKVDSSGRYNFVAYSSTTLRRLACSMWTFRFDIDHHGVKDPARHCE